jgi:predicted ATPase/DNA-binding CsgD family transcriptional regulator
VHIEPFAPPLVCPQLIGRDLILEAIEICLNQARGGQGQVFLVGGEAGVGKSRLVAEVCARARSEGFVVLAGYCAEQELSSPYAPLRELLRRGFMQQPLPAQAADLDPLTRELAQLLPGIVPLPAGLESPPKDDPETRKHRLFGAIIHYFARLAAQQPLLLLLEDLHWSDDSTLAFLRHVARYATTQPLFLLMTYRSDEVDPHLHDWLTQLERERLTHEVVLARLKRPEVAAMLQAIFALEQPVRAEFVDAIYHLTEGNPFFIEEVLKSLNTSGDLFYGSRGWDRTPLDTLRIPRSVYAAVQRRGVQLSPPALQVLRLAAVVGQRFDIRILRELAPFDEPTLIGSINEWLAAQLVVEESVAGFAFRHALTRQAILADLLAFERRSLHHTVAEIIERVFTAEHERYLAELAYHFFEAQAWQQAVQYALRAGEQARMLHAPHATIAQLTRALTAADHLEVVSTPKIYLARGAAFELLGDFEAAHTDYQTALLRAQAVHEHHAEWEALLALGFLFAERDYQQAGDYFLHALKRARALNEPSLIAHSLNRMGNWHANIEHIEAAVEHHREAHALFVTLGDTHGLAETLDLLGMTSQLGGDALQSVAYYDQAIELFQEIAARPGVSSSLTVRAIQSGAWWIETMVPVTRSMDTAIHDVELARQIAREINWRAGEIFALFELAALLGPQGNYSRALDLAQTALISAEEIEHQQWIAASNLTLGVLYLDMLALPTAQQHLERALALAQQLGSQVFVRLSAGYLALTYIQQRQLGQATTILDTLLASDTPMQTMGQRLDWLAYGELELARGHPARALQIANQLIDSAANCSDGQVIPRLWKLRGEVQAACGLLAEAEAILIAACAAAEARGARPLLWRTQMALGTLRRTRRHAGANAAFAAARTLIETLANDIPVGELRTGFLEQTLNLLPRQRPLSALRTTKQQFGGLTRREREVARLLAQGSSNRAIAEALVLSERTIEDHVGNILGKLGFSSRAQVAAWAVEQRLLSEPED